MAEKCLRQNPSFNHGTPRTLLRPPVTAAGRIGNDKSGNVRNVARTADVHGQRFRGPVFPRSPLPPSPPPSCARENGARSSRRRRFRSRFIISRPFFIDLRTDARVAYERLSALIFVAGWISLLVLVRRKKKKKNKKTGQKRIRKMNYFSELS